MRYFLQNKYMATKSLLNTHQPRLGNFGDSSLVMQMHLTVRRGKRFLSKPVLRHA